MNATATLATIADRLAAIQREAADADDYARSGDGHTHRPEDDADRAAWSDVDEARRIAGHIAEHAAAITGGEYREPYNGHRNRETWTLSLWIDNDRGTYEAAREIVREHLTRDPYANLRRMVGTVAGDDDADGIRRAQLHNAGRALREFAEETYSPEEYGSEHAGPVSDLWQYALAVADWYSIAGGLGEDLPSTTDDTDDTTDDDETD